MEDLVQNLKSLNIKYEGKLVEMKRTIEDKSEDKNKKQKINKEYKKYNFKYNFIDKDEDDKLNKCIRKYKNDNIYNIFIQSYESQKSYFLIDVFNYYFNKNFKITSNIKNKRYTSLEYEKRIIKDKVNNNLSFYSNSFIEKFREEYKIKLPSYEFKSDEVIINDYKYSKFLSEKILKYEILSVNNKNNNDNIIEILFESEYDDINDKIKIFIYLMYEYKSIKTEDFIKRLKDLENHQYKKYIFEFLNDPILKEYFIINKNKEEFKLINMTNDEDLQKYLKEKFKDDCDIEFKQLVINDYDYIFKSFYVFEKKLIIIYYYIYNFISKKLIVLDFDLFNEDNFIKSFINIFYNFISKKNIKTIFNLKTNDIFINDSLYESFNYLIKDEDSISKYDIKKIDKNYVYNKKEAILFDFENFKSINI